MGSGGYLITGGFLGGNVSINTTSYSVSGGLTDIDESDAGSIPGDGGILGSNASIGAAMMAQFNAHNIR
jgi:hypothetical protein